MAVQRLTDYTRRIWVGLSTDEPDPDMQAGDVIYYMDTSTCSIITGIPAPGSIDTKDLPDVGGGGGGLMEGVHPTFKNNRASTVAITYARLFSSLSGYVNGSMNISANSEKILDLLNQDGYLIFRSNVNPTSITYGNETLPLVVSVDSGYYCKIPYKGDEEVYQMYF